MPATPPFTPPIGMLLGATGRQADRAFDDALAGAGGSRSVWLVLLAVRVRAAENQRQIAQQAGIQGPTLTHHLNAMERDGLLVRRRDPQNRRVHIVELTPAGEQLFERLRDTAVDFDRRLRKNLSDDDTARLRELLTRIGENVRAAV